MPKLDRTLTNSTAQKLPAPPQGFEIYWCGRTPGFGVRVTANGARSWVLQRRVDGKPVRRTIGDVARPGFPRGLTAQQALDEAAKRKGELLSGHDTVKDRRTRRARDEAHKEHTLAALCTDYTDWLEQRGKASHRDVRNIFDNHVRAPWPKTAQKIAADVTKGEIVDMLRRLHEQGHESTARKLRAYLHAAYTCALQADSDAAMPKALRDYHVEHNPVAGVKAIRVKADKNPLPLADLRRYWLRLQKEPGPIGAALRLHLLTGAQRVAQLARLTRADITLTTLALADPKGKRTEPRVHLLPLTRSMREEFKKLPSSGFVLSSDNGATPMHPTNLSAWASQIAGEVSITSFQLKRVRSGVESALAQAGVPLHHRGQLQSHGLSGVQEKHYDAHTYLPEKAKALATLYRLLNAPARGKVVPIARGRSRQPSHAG